MSFACFFMFLTTFWAKLDRNDFVVKYKIRLSQIFLFLASHYLLEGHLISSEQGSDSSETLSTSTSFRGNLTIFTNLTISLKQKQTVEVYQFLK